MSPETTPTREGKNRKSFRLKVEILERAADSGSIPENLRNIKLLKELAAWEDKTLGLTAWTSANVHSKNGHNPDLVKRWVDVRGRIALIVPHRRTGRTLRESQKQEITLRSEVKVLLLQNEALLVLEERYQKQLRMAARDLDAANDRLRSAGLATVPATFQVP
ncbi:hypothetical protein [Sphingomonas sp. OTU376]|uniref:hypothetical protein n=1 Tax=Sphingomonas sp. OTU376 TaxID=3043863 RepID=UPI00313B78EE